MIINLTPEQEIKLTPGAQAEIQRYAQTIVDAIPEIKPEQPIEPIIEPAEPVKVMTLEEKLRTPNACHICDAKRIVDLKAFEAKILEVKR